MDQSSKVANPARGQLNRENYVDVCRKITKWTKKKGRAPPAKKTLCHYIQYVCIVMADIKSKKSKKDME